MDATLVKFLLVFLGGGLGSAGRYGIGLLVTAVVSAPQYFPVATLLSNVMASLLVGAVAWYTHGQSGNTSSVIVLLVATGFCGGLSTFSTFALENARLFQEGHTAIGIVNICISVASCIAAAWVLLPAVQR